MAIAVATISAVATASSTTVTITKPTGLAVGDLMVAFLNATGNTSSGLGTWTQLSGWTALTTNNWYHTSGNVAITNVAQYKIADSGDVAASNFTFTYSSSTSLSGAIYRITGQRPGIEIVEGQAKTDNDSSDHASSPKAYTCGVTPVISDSLLLLLGATRNGSSFGSYAIATSDPGGWTEGFDSDGIFSAYVNRTETTATGDVTIAFSGSNPTGICLNFYAISPAFGVTVSPSTITASGASPNGIQAPTISGGATVSPSTLTGTSEVKTPTEAGQVDWSAQGKSSSGTWTPQSKS